MSSACFYISCSLVGVVKSVLTTIIGFFTFGGVPVTFLTVTGVALNTFGGILYTYAKYIEKKALLKSVHSLLMPASQETATTAHQGNAPPSDNETPQQTDTRNDSVTIGIDDRTHA